VTGKALRFHGPAVAQKLWRAGKELDFIINYDIKCRMGQSTEQTGLCGEAEEE